MTYVILVYFIKRENGIADHKGKIAMRTESSSFWAHIANPPIERSLLFFGSNGNRMDGTRISVWSTHAPRKSSSVSGTESIRFDSPDPI